MAVRSAHSEIIALFKLNAANARVDAKNYQALK
jgi:hypothetical protein